MEIGEQTWGQKLQAQARGSSEKRRGGKWKGEREDVSS